MARDMHSRRRLLAGTALTGAVLALAGTAAANPVDPTVVHGTVGFSSNGPVLEVRQGSDKAIIDWRGFDIGTGEATRFVQPGAGSIALNRVTGGQQSHIDGSLTANGRIFLINPNGILFGAGSVVDVGGLVASTANIANDRFLSGDYRFDIASPVAGAAISNAGTIDAGMAALVAPQVRNSGTIRAGLGRVTLGAAQRFTLDLAGDGLISFDAGSAVDGAKLEQAGLVQGASVLLSAATAARVVDNVIDMTGVVQARGVRQEGGDIILDGGEGSVSVSGTLNADAVGQGDGGTITVLSDSNVRFTGAISARGAGTGRGGDVDLSSQGGLTYRGSADLTSDSGVKGTLLLDPKNIIVASTGVDGVAGNDTFAENPAADATIAAADVVTALNGANLVLQANNDISVNAKVDARANAGAGDLTLRAGRSVALNADVNVKGAFTAIANDPAAIAAQRDPGAGSIRVSNGVTVGSTGSQTFNGDLSLAGNLITSGSGAVGITGALTVADLATIVTAGGAADGVSVAGATNGAGFLVIDAGAGAVRLGTVGGAQALSGLSVAGGTVALNSVQTSGLQDYAGAITLSGDLVSTVGGAVRLGGPVTLTSDSSIVTAGFAGDDIQVVGAVNGPYALVADAGVGVVTFSGAVGSSRALTLLSAGGSSVRLGSVTTSGLQDYAGAITLSGDLVSTTGGSIRLGGPVTLTGNSSIVTAGFANDDIQVAGTVNGPYALVADAGAGAVTFAGAVGSSRALTLLSAGGSSVRLGNVTTSGLQDYAGAVTLSGDLVSTVGGSIRLGGPVTLAGNSSVVTAGFAGDNIQVAGTVNGPYALVADAGAGAVTFASAVGAGRALTLLSAGGSSVRLGSVTTSGLQDYAGAVTLSGDLVSTTGGSIRLGGPVTLAGNSSIVTAGFAGDDIQVAGTVNGPYALIADAGAGAVTFAGAVGASRALTLLSAGGASVTLGSVTTSGLQDYAGAVTLSGDLVSTTGGSIRLGGPVTLAGNSSVVTAGFAGNDIGFQGNIDGAYSLVADAGQGQVRVDGTVGGKRALTLFAAGGASVKLGDVTTSGRQDYAGAITLAGNLVSTGGGSIRMAGPVGLAANSAIVTAGFAGDDIEIAGAVDGAHALVLDAGAGRIGLTGMVGAGRALTSFAAGAASVVLRDVTTVGQQDYAGAVSLNGHLVSTVGGAIRVGGPLTLTGDSAIVSAGYSGDDIRLAGAVNGPYALVIDAGAGRATLADAVGGSSALKLLSVAGAGVSLRGVKTTGQQDYAGAITLNGDLTSSTGGNIRLGGPVTLAADTSIRSAGAASDSVLIGGAVSGPYRMTIRAGSGAVGLDGAVSGLSALDVTGGAVTFAGPVNVTAALTATGTRLTTGSLAASAVTLAGTEALTAGPITAGQDVRVTAGKGATLGTVTARTLTANAGTDLRLAGVTGDSARLSAGNRIAATGLLSLTGDLTLETAGTATGLDVRVGSLTYRGAGRFGATGTVAGVAGTDAADLVLVAGSRTGTYLFADRPVFGVAALVDRHRLDIPLVDTVPADDGDVRTAPLVLDQATIKDDLISFQD